MHLYNTSFVVEKAEEKSFVLWMKDRYLPLIKNKDWFQDCYFCRLVSHQEPEFSTYTLQIHLEKSEDMDSYIELFESECLPVVNTRFQNKIYYFNTSLEEA